VTALTPGIISSDRICEQASTWRAIAHSTRAISWSSMSMWRMQPSTVRRSSTGSATWASQTRPRTPNASLIGGAPESVRINAACTWFFSRVRYLHTLCAPADQSSTHPGVFIRHPDLCQEPARQQPRKQDRIGCDRSWPAPWPSARTALASANTTRATNGSKMRAIPTALPVGLHHHLVGGREALNQRAAAPAASLRFCLRAAPCRAR